MSSHSIKIAIADDDLWVAQLLENFLEELEERLYPPFEILLDRGEEDFLQELPTLYQSLSVAILKLEMKYDYDLDYIEELQEIAPSLKLVLLTPNYDPSFVFKMGKEGIQAYLPTDTKVKQIVRAIQCLYSKGYYLSPQQEDLIVKQYSIKEPLTKMKKETIILFVLGRTVSEIADFLFITERSVVRYLKRIAARVGLKSIDELRQFKK